MRFFNLGLVALAGVALSQLPTTSIEEPPPGLIDSPAEPPPDKLCSSTLGIIRPCTSFSKSPTPTVTTAIVTTLTRPTKTPGSSTASTPAASTASPDGIKNCFLPHGPCETLFQNMTLLWDTLSEDTPIGEDYPPFDRVFCDPNEVSARDKTALPSCSQCCSPPGHPSPAWPSFQTAVQSFCEDSPSVYELSKEILHFVDLVVEKPFHISPAGLNPRVADLVRAWEGKYPSGGRPMETSTVQMGSSPTGLPLEVVTKGLTQVPRAWPYTRVGAARRPGETATFTVTKEGEGGAGVFVVVEGVMWNPRPLDSFDVFGNFTQSVVGVGGLTSSGVGAGETTASLRSSTRPSFIPIPTLFTRSRP